MWCAGAGRGWAFLSLTPSVQSPDALNAPSLRLSAFERSALVGCVHACRVGAG
jgi:hypothetical protein